MFSKTANAAPARPAARSEPPAPTEPSGQRRNVAATLIAENLVVEGGVSGDGELHVDGVIRGDLRVGRLTIGETGLVEGSIVAESVEARGRIVGTITARQVRLHATAQVEGDITHEQLAMELGAYFQGRSLRLQRTPEGAQVLHLAGEPAA